MPTATPTATPSASCISYRERSPIQPDTSSTELPLVVAVPVFVWMMPARKWFRQAGSVSAHLRIRAACLPLFKP